jgi:hypothetical protein
MPQFVILRHVMPEGSVRPSHFDLMLEDAGALLTWSLEDLPTLETPRPALELPPHRLSYLSYEGPVSNNRGDVSKVAKGSIEWLKRNPDRLELAIDDGQWKGQLILERIDREQWTVVLQEDASPARFPPPYP